MTKLKEAPAQNEFSKQALVPCNWKICDLQSVCLMKITDGTHQTPTYCDQEGGIPFISAKDVTTGQISWDNIKYIPLELHKELHKRLATQRNDVLLAKNGTTGVAAIVDTDIVFDIYVTLAVLRPDESCIIPRYLLNVINSPICKMQFDDHLTGIGVPNLHLRDIRTVKIPLPPLAEQNRIVERIESLFEKLDRAKELAQNALDSYETRKAAILHKAFTGELTVKWRNENGVVMESWDEKTLLETDIEIIDGDRGNNYPKKEEFSDNGYCLFLNAKNVTKNGFVFEDMQFISKKKDEVLRKGKLIRGDVILTTRGTVGNIAYYDSMIPYENIRINSGMVIYRGGKDFYKPFLCWMYKSDIILDQIENIKTGSAQPQLPIKDMKHLKLVIPSLPEQQEIVRILDGLFEKEQRAREFCDVIEKIDLMKKAILARAFRGELGTNDPGEKSAVGLVGNKMLI